MRRKKEKLVDTTSLRVLLIGLVLVGVAVCGLFAFRISLLRAAAQEETNQYLREVSMRIAETVDSRIDATFRALHITAGFYVEMEDPTLATEYLKTFAAKYDFRRMAVTQKGGPMVTTDGTTIPTEGLAGVAAVLAGGREIASMTRSPIDGQSVVVYDVPMNEDGQLSGVLSAVTDLQSLQEYLGVESFGGGGFAGIINSAGDIIVTTKNKSSANLGENFYGLVATGQMGRGYSLEVMQADVLARRGGTLDYTLANGAHKIMCYEPLAVSDWYLLSVVSSEVANKNARSYNRISETIDFVIIALFVALVVVMARVFWMGQKRVERLAFIDPVTGGISRTAFEQLAAAQLAVAQPGTYCMVSMDLKGFKLINESFGSEAGNGVLLHIYQTITQQLAEGELAGRIGGDVFNILLKNGSRQDIERRLGVLAESVNRFNMDLTEKYYLPLFQGVYVVGEAGLDIITVQDRANVARKENKRIGLGRLNTCAFYEDIYREQMRREKEIDNRMETALAKGEFVVYLQPKVELRWNTIVGAEALVRWQDPERGLVPPDEFIPLFEQNGFIVSLDRYVFEQVCLLQRKWLDAGRKPMSVSVNVSRTDIASPDFLEELVRIKEKHQIPDGLLELELTETLFMENVELLLALTERAQQAGFLCSLDDFGSGYSSLGLLQKIPVDVIKLDRSFFAASEQSQRGEYVVQSTLELARRLKMRTVCEGVEEPSQLRCLQKYQCDMVQGFVFSPPVPIEQFEALVLLGQPLTPESVLSR